MLRRMSKRTTADDLSRYMTRHGYNDHAMAERCGVTHVAIWKWKTGKGITPENRRKLAAVTDGAVPVRCPGCERRIKVEGGS